jgi:WD40 repeat protein
LVTGASDCIGRIWKTVSSVAQALDVSTNGDEDSATSSSSSSLRSNNNPLLLAELCGHTKSISDIAWSNRGDRVMTASQDDGTVRVWSWLKGFTKLEHVIIKITNNDSSNQAAPSSSSVGGGVGRGRRFTAAGGSRGANASSAQRLKVDMVAWSCDDKLVVTSQAFRPSSPTLALGHDWKQTIKVSFKKPLRQQCSSMCALLVFTT